MTEDSNQARMKYIARGGEIVQERQNFQLAAASGSVVAVICAILWSVITILTEYQISYMALALGGAVAATIRFLGNGLENRYAYLGGVLSVFGCLLGNSIAICYFIAKEYGISWVDSVMTVMANIQAFGPMYFTGIDLFFYATAMGIGALFSMQKYTGEQLELLGRSDIEN